MSVLRQFRFDRASKPTNVSSLLVVRPTLSAAVLCHLKSSVKCSAVLFCLPSSTHVRTIINTRTSTFSERGLVDFSSQKEFNFKKELANLSFQCTHSLSSHDKIVLTSFRNIRQRRREWTEERSNE